MPSITFKRDPLLIAVAAVLVIAVTVLVGLDKVTWKEAAAFLGGSLALPGLFGAASKEKPKDDDDDNTPTLRPPPPPMVEVTS